MLMKTDATTRTETVGEAIARHLADIGVTRVFGVISIHNMPILDAIARRQKQYGRLVASVSQRFEDLPTVDVRQHDVEDQEVVVAGHGLVKTIEPVAGQLDDETGLTKPLAQVIRGDGLILDDQQFHVLDISERSQSLPGADFPSHDRDIT